jgi:hypothetical protein
MSLKRGLAALSAAALVAVLSAACGGLSMDDAAVRCDQEKAGKSSCFDDSVYAACLDCYERCGDSCVPQSTCPSTYLCPGDKPSSTTSSSTGN